MANRSALTWPGAITAWVNTPIGKSATYVNPSIPARTASTAVKSQEIPMGMDQTQVTTPLPQNVGQSGNRCGPTPGTTIASGSNGVSLPTGTINVASTTGFNIPGSITITIGSNTTVVAYTNIAGNSFTGCTGGTGTLATGNVVGQWLSSIPYNQSLIVPSSTDNYPPAFIGATTDGTGNLRYEGGNFAHCTNGALPTAGHFGSRGTIIDDATGGASGGSGLSTLYGTIRYLEFTNGTDGSTATVGGYTFPCIRHCLRIDLRTTDLSVGTVPPGTPGGALAPLATAPGYRWPANKADSGYNSASDPNYYSNSVAAICEGALLAIPWTVDLNTLGLTTKPAKQLAWTFQNFGCRPANTQHGSTWAIATEWSVGTGGATQRVAIAPPLTDTSSEFFNLFGFPMYASPGSAFAIDMNIIITNLQVVDNDTQTNIGGGGTPLTYAAPSFGASINAPFIQQVNGQTAVAGTTQTVANLKTQLGSVLSLTVGARVAATVTTPARVQSFVSTAQSGTGNSTAVAPASSTVTVTTGNTLMAVSQYRTSTGVTGLGATPFSATGTATIGSWLKLGAVQDTLSPSQTDLEVWTASVVTGGTLALTVTYGSSGAGSLIVEEVTHLTGLLDVSVSVNSGTLTTISVGPTASTVTANDYVMAAYGSTGTPTFTEPGTFSPAGSSLGTNPIATVSNTGTDNNQVEVSDQLAATSGNTQSFSITTTGGHFVAILVCMAPVISGTAPTVAISGGGTWTQRFSVDSPAGLGVCAAFDINPTGQVAANGITITSSESGSIEYEFYEIANALYQGNAHATGTSTTPTVSITPVATSDVQVGVVFVPNISASLTPTGVSTWTNDDVTQGLATNANSQIVSGGNVAGSISSQTYNATAAPSAPWVAGILNYSQSGVPSQIAQPSISAGQAQVQTTFVAPNNNGSSLLSYTALVYSGVASDGSGGTLARTITSIAVADYSITPYTITTLTNGVQYSVAWEAVNANGTSVPSARSLGATPMTPTTAPATPLAPTVVVTSSTTAQVTIVPPADGGQPITSYTFNCYNPYPTLFATQTQSGNVFTFSGLTPGNQYGFTGIASNGNGPSDESPITLATPGNVYSVSKTIMAGTAQPTPFKPM